MDVDRLERDEAERTIIARDQARAYYYKRYFDIDDPDDPKLYHFVLNTSDLGIEYATTIVIEAVQALEAGDIRRRGEQRPIDRDERFTAENTESAEWGKKLSPRQLLMPGTVPRPGRRAAQGERKRRFCIPALDAKRRSDHA